ncbi:MAG: radical SAM protein, partial [Mucilaginibacter sp.]
HRYKTLRTHRISALPIVILMPHSACNCRCVMCDIWKDNKNLQQLTEDDVAGLLGSLMQLETKLVVMSGGEALLNQNFFRLCEILNKVGIKVSLLTTGLTIKHHAAQIIKWVNDVIVSLDGDQQLHDAIRNIPGAFQKLKDGVQHLHQLDPNYKITARTVIHRLNFWNWASIIHEAKSMWVKQISFLPADVSSHAFNRQMAWEEPRQDEILLSEKELPELQNIINGLLIENREDFNSGFIAESPEKIQHIYDYYAAHHGLNHFPYKKCNAPWVSAVVEADGNVRPCFFHDTIGNIRERSLTSILNSEDAIQWRKTLDMSTNTTCVKCVCSLNLSPVTRP